MRPLWTGTISFGLVNIPVELYSATISRTLDLDMLRRKDLCPINYAKVCRATGEEVPLDEIVKGYEYAKGDYVLLEEGEIKNLDAKKTSTLDIQKFVFSSEIEYKFFEKPYYLKAQKGGEKAYALLRDCLEKSKKVAVTKYVLKTKEDLGVIYPDGQILVLNQLRYSEEIKDPAELVLVDIKKYTKAEEDLAIKLISHLSGKFDAAKYHDTFKEELEELIEEKSKGKKHHPQSEAPTKTETDDIIKRLKESLEKGNSIHAS